MLGVVVLMTVLGHDPTIPLGGMASRWCRDALRIDEFERGASGSVALVAFVALALFLRGPPLLFDACAETALEVLVVLGIHDGTGGSRVLGSRLRRQNLRDTLGPAEHQPEQRSEQRQEKHDHQPQEFG